MLAESWSSARIFICGVWLSLSARCFATDQFYFFIALFHLLYLPYRRNAGGLVRLIGGTCSAKSSNWRDIESFCLHPSGSPVASCAVENQRLKTHASRRSGLRASPHLH